ncbi:MAG: type II toxin-antitoxin system YafQ family toxin [Candidatus Cloacimonetes bacterium]|nr:type II toxin-antitoxin system YafQ family toxin [Candidatus Cloacimonadota bacterium]
MNKYKIVETKTFLKNLKKLNDRKYDLKLLFQVIDILSIGQKLPKKHKDHALKGKLKGFRECHILPDWLLIYRIDKENLVLVLSRTGTHNDVL